MAPFWWFSSFWWFLVIQNWSENEAFFIKPPKFNHYYAWPTKRASFFMNLRCFHDVDAKSILKCMHAVTFWRSRFRESFSNRLLANFSKSMIWKWDLKICKIVWSKFSQFIKSQINEFEINFFYFENISKFARSVQEFEKTAFRSPIFGSPNFRKSLAPTSRNARFQGTICSREGGRFLAI